MQDSEPWREKVARIIDPVALKPLSEWQERYREVAADLKLERDTPNLLRLAQSGFDDLEQRRQEALAKADAIAALSPAPEGWREKKLREALGFDLPLGEQHDCGPLAWLRSAIETLGEPDVIAASEGDDPDAYQTMLTELRILHTRLLALSASPLPVGGGEERDSGSHVASAKAPVLEEDRHTEQGPWSLFRRRPADNIQAYQFTQAMIEAHLFDQEPLPEGVTLAGAGYHRERREIYRAMFAVHTMHDDHSKVVVGDWIIPEPVPNRYYPVNPEVFAATYEPVAPGVSQSDTGAPTAALSDLKPSPPQGESTAAGGWLPIESAPKDGTLILLLSREYENDMGVNGVFHVPPKCHLGQWNPEGTSWVDQNGLLGGETYTLAETGTWSSGGGWFQPNEVTHWMPLPPPPAAGQDLSEASL